MKPNPRIIAPVALVAAAAVMSVVVARRGNGPELGASGTVEATEVRLG